MMTRHYTINILQQLKYCLVKFGSQDVAEYNDYNQPWSWLCF